jgi:hypothetical protein
MAKTLIKSMALSVITEEEHYYLRGVAALRFGISSTSGSRLLDSALAHMDEEGKVEFKRDQYGSYDDVDREIEHLEYAKVYAACNQDWDGEERMNVEKVAKDFADRIKWKIDSNAPASGDVQSEADLLFGDSSALDATIAEEKKAKVERYFKATDHLITYCTDLVTSVDPMVSDEPPYIGEYLLSAKKKVKGNPSVIDYVIAQTKQRFILAKASADKAGQEFDNSLWVKASTILKEVQVFVS